MASIVSEPDKEKAALKNIKAKNIWLDPNGEQLAKMANLLAQGKLKVIIGHRFPLTAEGIREAHALSETHHAKGKIVIEI